MGLEQGKSEAGLGWKTAGALAGGGLGCSMACSKQAWYVAGLEQGSGQSWTGLDGAGLSLSTDWSGAGMEPDKSRGRGRSRGPKQELGQEQG